jgi:hypothetical protein
MLAAGLGFGDDSGDQRRGTGRVGRGGVGEKPFEGFAPTGRAPKDLPFKKRRPIKPASETATCLMNTFLEKRAR